MGSKGWFWSTLNENEKNHTHYKLYDHFIIIYDQKYLISCPKFEELLFLVFLCQVIFTVFFHLHKTPVLDGTLMVELQDDFSENYCSSWTVSQWASSLEQLEAKCSSVEKQGNIFRREVLNWNLDIFRKLQWLLSDWQSQTVSYSGVKHMQGSPWLLKWLQCLTSTETVGISSVQNTLDQFLWGFCYQKLCLVCSNLCSYSLKPFLEQTPFFFVTNNQNTK